MNVLVVGQGGREHALAWKLAQSPQAETVYVAPGNAGTAVEPKCQNVPVGVTDLDGLVDLAEAKNVGLVVVGPEAPLVVGLADRLKKAGIPVFGPTAAAAQLEGSKAFCKEVCRQAGIPTGEAGVFDSVTAAEEYLRERENVPVVVKASGLAAGKGVFVCDGRAGALDALQEMMADPGMKQAASQILIEERLEGQEISVFAITDGRTIVPLDCAQDHKRAGENDTGPNTGGMGAYTPTPFATQEIVDRAVDKILLPTVHEMRRRKTAFSGVLYAGLMLTPQGPKLLEYNVRLGDPECQPLLMRMKSDLLPLLLAAATGKLADAAPPEWDPRPAVCVVMASEGYPGSYEKGKVIRGLDDVAKLDDVKVFHAGTRRSVPNAGEEPETLTDGGRVLGVTAVGSDLAAAKKLAYEAVRPIRWDGGWCRKDISDKARLAE